MQSTKLASPYYILVISSERGRHRSCLNFSSFLFVRFVSFVVKTLIHLSTLFRTSLTGSINVTVVREWTSSGFRISAKVAIIAPRDEHASETIQTLP